MDDAIHRWEVEAKQWATLDGEYRRLDDLTKTVLGELVNHSEDKAIYDLGSAAHNMVLRQDYWREESRSSTRRTIPQKPPRRPVTPLEPMGGIR